MFVAWLWAVRWFGFFFNDTATTEIYTLSLHDALPISLRIGVEQFWVAEFLVLLTQLHPDRKSTRLNSSHLVISYAVFCLKKHARRRSLHRERRARARLNLRSDAGRVSPVPCRSVVPFFFLILPGPGAAQPVPLPAPLGT